MVTETLPETPTQVEPPAPETVEQPDFTVTPETTEPPETPLLEGEAPDGDKPPEAAPLPENWRERKEAKELRSEGYREAQSHSDKNLRQLRVEHTENVQRVRQEAEASYRAAGILEISEQIATALQEHEDPEALKLFGKLIKDNASWANVFDVSWQKGVRAQGKTEGLSEASGYIYQGLPKALADQLGEEGGEVALLVREGKVDTEQALDRKSVV